MTIVAWWNEALEALSGEPFFEALRVKTSGRGLLVCDNLFGTYVRAVCGQQVNTAVAEKTARAVIAFAREGGQPCERLADCGIDELRALGLSTMKAQTLKAIACGYREGSLRSEALQALNDTQVRERLTAVRGVGPWTADMVLIFGLNRPDVWAQKDFGLRKALQQAGLEHTDSARWAPWRTAATWLLWQSLGSVPVQY